MIENRVMLDVLEGKMVERPPVWLMRQAGRILPQYRAIRENVQSFKHLVKNPELAAEVTIQPVDELGVDAAIIFSDILVVPEAMGLNYELVEKVGPIFPKTIESLSDVKKLDQGEEAARRLDYVYKAISLTKEQLKNRVPLIGFCGAPWTILTYMIEGRGTKAFTQARKFLHSEPKTAQLLLEKITTTSIQYLKGQIEAGANVIQLFDSWAGVLSASQYQALIVPHLERIVKEVREVPIIVFSKGAWHSLEVIKEVCQPSCVGVDWTTDARWVREQLGVDQCLQGNFDPALLYSSPQKIRMEVTRSLTDFGVNHIVNLGHGVYPDTPLDHVKEFIGAVKDHIYK